METYAAVLRDVSSRSITEAAANFTKGDAPGQNRTFAPSIAEFVQEARRMEKLVPFMDKPRLQVVPTHKERYQEPSPLSRIRMGFKMSLLSAGLARKEVEMVAEANQRGLDHLMALAQQWHVPIPEELFKIKAA
jgi:hypothetical protein